MKINETFEGEKLRSGIFAGAATVGRPTGVDGKNRVPRRARVSAKEKEKLSAGGPGSGRKPQNAESASTAAQHRAAASYHESMAKKFSDNDRLKDYHESAAEKHTRAADEFRPHSTFSQNARDASVAAHEIQNEEGYAVR